MKLILSILIAICLFSFCHAAEELNVTTYYPSPNSSFDRLRVNRIAVGPYINMPLNNGEVSWGSHDSTTGVRRSRGLLSRDQGSSIELGGFSSTEASPYIMFHNDMTSPFDAKISLVSDDVNLIPFRTGKFWQRIGDFWGPPYCDNASSPARYVGPLICNSLSQQLDLHDVDCTAYTTGQQVKTALLVTHNFQCIDFSDPNPLDPPRRVNDMLRVQVDKKVSIRDNSNTVLRDVWIRNLFYHYPPTGLAGDKPQGVIQVNADLINSLSWTAAGNPVGYDYGSQQYDTSSDYTGTGDTAVNADEATWMTDPNWSPPNERPEDWVDPDGWKWDWDATNSQWVPKPPVPAETPPT